MPRRQLTAEEQAELRKMFEVDSTKPIPLPEGPDVKMTHPTPRRRNLSPEELQRQFLPSTAPMPPRLTPQERAEMRKRFEEEMAKPIPLPEEPAFAMTHPTPSRKLLEQLLRKEQEPE